MILKQREITLSTKISHNSANYGTLYEITQKMINGFQLNFRNSLRYMLYYNIIEGGKELVLVRHL